MILTLPSVAPQGSRILMVKQQIAATEFGFLVKTVLIPILIANQTKRTILPVYLPFLGDKHIVTHKIHLTLQAYLYKYFSIATHSRYISLLDNTILYHMTAVSL